jgi:hypothetical protein
MPSNIPRLLGQAVVVCRVPVPTQGKLECRNWKDEEKLQRERMRKRNRGGGDDDDDDDDGSALFTRPAKLVVSARPMREKELQERGQRQAQLAPQGAA